MESTSEHSSNATEEAPIVNNAAAVLAKTVSALQESLDGACSQMMNNLSNSVQTMSMMNMMMEEFVQRSLRFESTVESGKSSSCVVKLKMVNTCRMPILSLNLEVSIAELTDTELNVEFSGSVSQGSERVQDIAAPQKIMQLPSYDLGPLDERVLELQLTLPNFQQYNGTLTATMPSPGSGKPLVSEHRFGIYLLHQCEKNIVHEGAEDLLEHRGEVDVVKTSIDAGILRDLFAIADTQGIVSRSIFKISHKSELADEFALLYITGLSADGASIEGELWSSAGSRMLLPATVINELQSLSSAKRAYSSRMRAYSSAKRSYSFYQN